MNRKTLAGEPSAPLIFNGFTLMLQSQRSFIWSKFAKYSTRIMSFLRKILWIIESSSEPNLILLSSGEGASYAINSTFFETRNSAASLVKNGYPK